MSDNSYTLDHAKFQALAHHIKKISEYLDQMEILVFSASREFKRLNKSFEKNFENPGESI